MLAGSTLSLIGQVLAFAVGVPIARQLRSKEAIWLVAFVYLFGTAGRDAFRRNFVVEFKCGADA